MSLLSGGSVSWVRSYLGDEDITEIPRRWALLEIPGAAVAAIFDVPELLMSGYEKRLARFKPLAKKG